MYILVAYGVGPQALHLLLRYWDRLLMVSIVVRYYRGTFKGQLRVTQGYPFSPTIFNVVVDVVLRHWVYVVSEEEKEVEEGPEGFGRDIHRLMEYLYANDGILAFTRVKRPQ